MTGADTATPGPATPESATAESASAPSMVRRVLDDRILTAPNVITFVRLLLIPVFLWLLFAEDNPASAAVVLAVMGGTDWIDGQVARRFHQVSELGKILDPAADRILLLVGVVATTVYGAVPLWLAIPVLFRETVMFIAVPTLAMLGAERIDVTFVGKAGAFGLMFAFPMLLFGTSTISWAPVVRDLGWIAAVGGLTLSYVAAFSYIPAARRALAAGRAEKAAAGR